MSVEYETDRAALAGSTGINSAIYGQPGTEAPLVGPGDAQRQDDTVPKRTRGGSTKRPPPPRPLVLICERCSRAIVGTGAGFAFCDLREAHKAAVRTATGYIDPAKARWTLAHRECAPEALQALSPYFRLWVEDFSTVDTLLDAMATLARTTPWHAWTDWGSLVREVLSDTETVSVQTPRAQRVAARAEGLPDADSRHGTCVGYDHWRCRCEPCRAAASQKRRQQRAAKAMEQ